jgi:radical SAM protein with 4Fe4S-binding SPASM domain
LRPASGIAWSKKEVNTYLTELRKIGDFYVSEFKKGNKFRFDLFEYYFDNDKVTPCSKGKNLTILPNGNLLPCYGFLLNPEKVNMHIIGNVFNGIDFSLRRKYVNNSEEKVTTICKSNFNCDMDSCYRYCLFMYDDKGYEKIIKNLLYRELMERKISKDVFSRIKKDLY